jgi:hypothetical protein
MAIGPNPQILLGCTGTGPAPYQIPRESVVISAIDGSTIFDIPVNGVDEVWYNPTNNSYFLAANNNTDPLSGNIAPIIGVVDAVSDETVGRPHLDQSVATANPNATPVNTSAHSIAVDPSAKIVYVMSAKVGLCAFSCLAFFQAVGTDDPPAVVGKK